MISFVFSSWIINEFLKFIYRESPRYQNTHFLYAQIETKPLCSHWLYCVQNVKTTVHSENNMKLKYIKNMKQNSH
jgi:hypothetical protein